MRFWFSGLFSAGGFSAGGFRRAVFRAAVFSGRFFRPRLGWMGVPYQNSRGGFRRAVFRAAAGGPKTAKNRPPRRRPKSQKVQKTGQKPARFLKMAIVRLFSCTEMPFSCNFEKFKNLTFFTLFSRQNFLQTPSSQNPQTFQNLTFPHPPI